MNKKQLIGAIENRLGCTKPQAAEALDATLTCIEDGLWDDGKVTISLFGTFFRRKRPARLLRVPKSGEKKPVPERYAVVFKISEANPLRKP